MAKLAISTKRLAINKSNTQMVVVTAVASFISVFSLVAAHAVLGQNEYQSRVIHAKQIAHVQLQANIHSVNQLDDAYATFVGANTNAIGGALSGTGQNDGSNAKIILDALPSTYDFPALTSSLSNLLTSQNLNISSIAGTDDQLNQEDNTGSANPQAVPIPFSFTVNKASYSSVQTLITSLQNSIRPIAIDTLTLSGGVSNMTVTVTAHTYYQPAKTLSITKETVK